MFKLKKNKFVLSLLSAGLFLAACGNDSADTTEENTDADVSTDSVENVEIDFWHMYTDGTMADEVIPADEIEIFYQNETWRRKTLTNYTVRELQVPIFADGECVYELPSLVDVRQYSRFYTFWCW